MVHAGDRRTHLRRLVGKSRGTTICMRGWWEAHCEGSAGKERGLYYWKTTWARAPAAARRAITPIITDHPPTKASTSLRAGSPHSVPTRHAPPPPKPGRGSQSQSQSLSQSLSQSQSLLVLPSPSLPPCCLCSACVCACVLRAVLCVLCCALSCPAMPCPALPCLTACLPALPAALHCTAPGAVGHREGQPPFLARLGPATMVPGGASFHAGSRQSNVIRPAPN